MGSRKQGVVSWLTSIIALLIGLQPVWRHLAMVLAGREGLANMAEAMNAHYNPLSKDKAALAEGYGSMIGGIVFKVVSSEITKRAKIKSVIPALHG